MDLALTDEQQLLAASARRFVGDRTGADYRRRIAASERGADPAMWAQFAELGWLALGLAEEDGGLGAGPLESALVCTALGRGLVAEPFVETAVAAAGVLARVPASPRRSELLAAIGDGSAIVTLAHNESDRETPVDAIASTATKDGEGWRLSARKTLVRAAPLADALLVSARGPDAECLIFVVGTDAGLRLTPIETLDGRRAAHVELTDASLPPEALLARGTAAAAALTGAADDVLVAVCAEAVGCMEVLLQTTTDYVRTRVQFGRPLSANQVIRHRLADMACHLEEARAIALGAALCPRDDPRRPLVTSSAKVKVGTAARFVAEQAVQLHGGMGVTEELDVGAFFKRLLGFEMSYGTERHHLRRAMTRRGRTQGMLA